MRIQYPSRIVLCVYAKLACAFVALFFVSVSFAQSAPSGPSDQGVNSSFIELYQEYENAGFGVRWSGDARYFSLIRDKIARYEYLVLYTPVALLDSSRQAVIQFGFFKTESEASAFVSANTKAFPGLKTVPVSRQEHQALFASSSDQSDYFWLRPNTERGLSTYTALLSKAKAYYIKKQYAQALKYYAVLSLTQDESTAMNARELMAVCYERTGQTDEAEQMYRSLLNHYPDAKSSGRITQRLRALDTAANDEKSPLRKSTQRQNEDKTYWRGVIGQSFNQFTSGSNIEEDEDTFSALITNFDLHAGRSSGVHKFDVRLNGYDIYDMLDEGDDSKTAIKHFYAKYNNKALGVDAVGGRQKNYDSGVFTSFDGASVRYSPTDKWTVGASAGVPVYFSRFADYVDREFVSVNLAYDPNEKWRSALYFIQQTFYGETERLALGGRLSYFAEAFYSSLSMDYDLEFQELNLLRWSGTYQMSKKSQWSASYGRQRTPFLTASNVQVGQPYLSLENRIKNETLDYQALLDEALARTSLYEYGSLSYKYQIDEDLQLLTDVYHSLSTNVVQFLSDDDWESSVIDGGGRYFEYTSAGIQAVVQNLFGKQDTAILAYRHSDDTLSSSNSISVSENLRLGKKFSIKPKLLLRNVKRKSEESGQTKIRSSLALSYRPVRSAEIRAELGSEVVEDLDEKGTIDTTYFIIGYQARF